VPADDIVFVPRFVPFGRLSVRSNFEREDTHIHSEWKFRKFYFPSLASSALICGSWSLVLVLILFALNLLLKKHKYLVFYLFFGNVPTKGGRKEGRKVGRNV